MVRRPAPIGVRRIGRVVFGTATVFFAFFGLLVSDDARWLVAAGAFGIIWGAWDLLLEHVVVPLGDWASHIFVSGTGSGPPPNIRPTLDDTIRLLESHLEQRASRRVEINAAIRLEEIYRTVKKDPSKAQSVIDRVRQRYPHAPELRQFDRDEQD